MGVKMTRQFLLFRRFAWACLCFCSWLARAFLFSWCVRREVLPVSPSVLLPRVVCMLAHEIVFPSCDTPLLSLHRARSCSRCLLKFSTKERLALFLFPDPRFSYLMADMSPLSYPKPPLSSLPIPACLPPVAASVCVWICRRPGFEPKSRTGEAGDRAVGDSGVGGGGRAQRGAKSCRGEHG